MTWKLKRLSGEFIIQISACDLAEFLRAFENNAGSLLTSVWPKYQARTAWNGRKKLAAGFLKYYQDGNKGASTFVTMRRKLFEENGFKIEDIAQFESGMSTPILSNTAPALFWLIREIYARPELLVEVREEISHAIIEGSHDGNPTFTVDVASLKTKCPLFVAVYHEILRMHGIGTSARRVLQDTIIDNQYLVKKGTLILMPFAPVHAEQKWWGKNPKSFDISRHLKTDGPKRPAVAFRSFGGAPHLCPGRQVATLEILCIGAMLISRYDVEPALGYWTTPKLTYTMSGIATPSSDIAVNMKPLPGTDGGWGYEMGDPKLKFSLASN
jgi:cytochrome P450